MKSILSICLAFTTSASLAQTVPTQIKVQFVTPTIVRVQYAAQGTPQPEGNTTGVVLADRQTCNITSSTQGTQTIWQSDSLTVMMDAQTQALSFIDRQTGRTLLAEDARQPRLCRPKTIEKVIYDDATARTEHTANGDITVKDVLRRDTLAQTQEYVLSFDYQEGEAHYGLGCHIEDYMNLRGHTQYLTQHNLKATVPVINSTHGYGLLIDAGCGMVYDGSNGQNWQLTLDAAREADYYFMKGSSMDAVVAQYRYLTGECPMMPRYLFGYTQSKERYCSQQEVVDIVKEYRRRQVPLDMVVQDWNYWPVGWGYMHMDPKYYPDPKAMADSVHALNARLMVSIWPNPQYCPQATDFKQRGYMLEHSVYDAFSADARSYYWQYADREFFSRGFDAWWCDCSEPLDGDWKNMPTGYNHQNHAERYKHNVQILSEALGAERSNLYSLYHARGIYEHQRLASNQKRVVNLTRSSYAGQQRYSTITWNGDTYASWQSFARQIPAGLNFMATGCPYWSVDVGSFFTNHDRWNRWFYIGEFPKGCNDPAYREYYTRMFQWATFLPMLRSHGSDTPREIWRFGEPSTPYYDAILAMIHLRYQLLPYTYSLAHRVSAEHYTMTRLLAFDFAADPTVLDIKDEFMFGPALLVCPISTPAPTGQTEATRTVYLPKGTAWYDYYTNQRYEGGTTLQVSCPIDRLPLFVRAGSVLPMGPVLQYADQPTDAPIELRIYPDPKANYCFDLYADAGDGYDCETGAYSLTPITLKGQQLQIGARQGSYDDMTGTQIYRCINVLTQQSQEIKYTGKAKKVKSGK